MLERIGRLLASPVDGASLAMLRMGFGLGMVGEAHSFWTLRPEGRWIDLLFSQPGQGWNVPYHGFEWVQPWAPPGMAVHCAVLAAAGAGLALGLATRLSAVVLFLSWTYLAMIDATLFNNHYYVWSLLSLMFVFLPSARVWSLDRWLTRRLRPAADRPGCEVPFWGVFWVRSQLVCMYFYGAVTKLTYDYLVHAQPVRNGMQASGIRETFEAYLPNYLADWCTEQMLRPEAGYLFAYSGLLYDLLVGPLLIIRRTRALGIALTATFHGLNHFLLFDDIGWFPALAFWSTLIFLEPDWPRRLAAWLSKPRWPRPDWSWLIAGVLVFPPLGVFLGWKARRASPPEGAVPRRLSKGVALLLTVWIGFQYLWPLRHLLIEGDVNWTLEGERFSWRMKANQRNPGTLRLKIVDPALVRAGEHGELVLDRGQWTEPVVVYRQVDSRQVRWESLPAILLFFQPLAGERAVLNPYSAELAQGDAGDALAADFVVAADAPQTLSEAHRRATQLWQDRFGSDPTAYETFPLSGLLATLRTSWKDRRAPQSLLDLIDDMRRLAEQLADPALPAAEREPICERLHAGLKAAAQSRDFGGSLRDLLLKCHPLALSGALPPKGLGFLALEDRHVFQVDSRGFVELRRTSWPSDGPRLEIYADFDVMQPSDWRVLPERMLLEDPPGFFAVQWNQYRELTELKCQRIAMRPYFIHQYVAHVAELWTERFGRRPQIYVRATLGLNHHPRQTYIDPQVDLAAAPLKLLGHNDWIPPMRVRADAPPTTAQPRASSGTPPPHTGATPTLPGKP